MYVTMTNLKLYYKYVIRIDIEVHFTINMKIIKLRFGATCIIVRLQMQICQGLRSKYS